MHVLQNQRWKPQRALSDARQALDQRSVCRACAERVPLGPSGNGTWRKCHLR